MNARSNGGAARPSGALIAQRFEILKTIEQSGRVTSFLARDRSAEVPFGAEGIVKVDVLSEKASRDAAQVELFSCEARTAARLSHPNILGALEADVADRTHFRVFEHRPCAETLRDLLNREGWLDPARALRVAAQAASAIARAHESGVLHLKLQPERILIEPDGTVLITDFGIPDAPELDWARRARSEESEIRYISPEQAAGANIDHKSDLYSFGVLLFEMLTDRVPFDAVQADSIRKKHLTQAPLPPRLLRPDLPTELSDLVLSLLVKDPAKRFESVAALQREIDCFTGFRSQVAPFDASEVEAPLSIDLTDNSQDAPAESLSELDWAQASSEQAIPAPLIDIKLESHEEPLIETIEPMFSAPTGEDHIGRLEASAARQGLASSIEIGRESYEAPSIEAIDPGFHTQDQDGHLEHATLRESDNAGLVSRPDYLTRALSFFKGAVGWVVVAAVIAVLAVILGGPPARSSPQPAAGASQENANGPEVPPVGSQPVQQLIPPASAATEEPVTMAGDVADRNSSISRPASSSEGRSKARNRSTRPKRSRFIRRRMADEGFYWSNRYKDLRR